MPTALATLVLAASGVMPALSVQAARLESLSALQVSRIRRLHVESHRVERTQSWLHGQGPQKPSQTLARKIAMFRQELDLAHDGERRILDPIQPGCSGRFDPLDWQSFRVERWISESQALVVAVGLRKELHFRSTTPGLPASMTLIAHRRESVPLLVGLLPRSRQPGDLHSLGGAWRVSGKVVPLEDTCDEWLVLERIPSTDGN